MDTVMADDSTGNFLGGFVLGAMLGGMTALLLAPRAGSETRRILRDSVDTLPDTAEDTLDNLQVRCELLPEHLSANRSAIGNALRERIKTLIGVSTTVDVGAPDSIERTLIGKARRVLDQRPK